MNYYKIIKGLYSVIKRFDTLEEAQAFADTLGDGYTAEFYAPYVPLTLQDRLNSDLQFGQQLIYVFVEDNRIMEITSEQSEQVLVKFRDILAFAQTGAVISIQTYLPLIPVDDVFTQERKDKYIQMISDYLAQF
tara:strand:- start:722 stop:1123 length:402 start_codon:yes stop_codon:yes gene_type:complete